MEMEYILMKWTQIENIVNIRSLGVDMIILAFGNISLDVQELYQLHWELHSR